MFNSTTRIKIKREELKLTHVFFHSSDILVLKAYIQIPIIDHPNKNQIKFHVMKIPCLQIGKIPKLFNQDHL